MIDRIREFTSRIMRYVLRHALRSIYHVYNMDDYYYQKGRYDQIEYIYQEKLDYGNYLRKHTRNLKRKRIIGSLINDYEWNKEKEREKTEIENSIFGNADSYPDTYQKEINYLKSCGVLKVFPYAFSEEYLDRSVKVYDCGEMKYVLHNGKRLFFPKMRNDEISASYNQLVMEQDINSPHRYFSENVRFDGGIFVDVGCAEGIISLDIVERADRVFLLECSEEWIGALNETFRDYQDRVNIIKKYAGSSDNNKTITMDSLLKNYQSEKIFFKMDVEGMEMEVLRGCLGTMSRNNCFFSCTCYHTNSMEKEMRDFFENNGYKVETSEGYMLFIFGRMTLKNGMYERNEYPYFRRGIVRAYRP